jgi:hypothetical protein
MNLWFQCRYIPQTTILSGVIQPIANDKLIGDLEAHVIYLYILDPAPGFIQEDTEFETRRLFGQQDLLKVMQCQSAIDYVVNDENVPTPDIRCQTSNESHLSCGFCPIAIAGNLDKVEVCGYVETPQQIGEEDHSAFQHAHNSDFLAPIII